MHKRARFSEASDSDLRRLIGEYRERIRDFKREQEAIGWRNRDSEEWEAEQDNIDLDEARIAEIEAELERRRAR